MLRFGRWPVIGLAEYYTLAATGRMLESRSIVVFPMPAVCGCLQAQQWTGWLRLYRRKHGRCFHL